MYLNNKGSILIFTLIIFSVISTITMMCIGLNYSNKMIYNLEIKETKLIEEALSGIEICSSNIKNEVNQIINKVNNHSDFNNYVLSNGFINNIKDISKVHLSNIYIEISNNPIVDENSYCNFKIISTSIEGQYKKKYQASVKIKNPFVNEEEISNEDININNLVIIYDYKEI